MVQQVELFYKEAVGGFYDTAGNREHLLVRSTKFSLPGNAIALANHCRTLTGPVQRSPAGLTQFLIALKKRPDGSS